MATPSSSALLEARLRTSPGLDVVPLGALTARERAAVLEQDAEDDLWGVLRSRADGTVLRSVSTDLALLLLTLASPSVLPRYAVRRLGDDAERTVRRLVLDGLVEVEHGGAFLGGGAAGDLLGGRVAALGSGRISVLSAAALTYGQELTDLGARALALRLYAYGTCPTTPAERRRLGDPAAVDIACGTARGGPAARAVARGWTETPTGAGGRWRSWRARRAAEAGDPVGRHKLYVSPALDALPDALAAVAGGLADVPGAVAFKVGRDAAGLRRPDKLVAYFSSLEALHTGSGVLRADLAGCPAQGVPFTAALTPDGLLSWGVDPPAGSGLRTSWRMWVAERLAVHLVAAGAAGGGRTPPAELAVERLHLDGVDTERWVPTARMYVETT